MKSIATLVLLIACFMTTSAQDEFPLYEGNIPNSRPVANPERIVQRGGKDGRAIFDTAIPSLTVFRPAQPNGQAVIICPGGGYAKTAIDKEGMFVAEVLMQAGITAFVLKYRIPQAATNVDQSLAPLQDAQQAIRLVRSQADSYGIDPSRIGIIGFSAGGHLAASAATLFHKAADPNETDTTSVRPDFVGLIYPVISFSEELTHKGSRSNLLGYTPKAAEILYWSLEEQVGPESPPAFLVHAGDDRAVPVGNSLAYYQACLQHEIPAEMHLYPGGGHGFGMYNPTTEDAWIDRLKNWLKKL